MWSTYFHFICHKVHLLFMLVHFHISLFKQQVYLENMHFSPKAGKVLEYSTVALVSDVSDCG